MKKELIIYEKFRTEVLNQMKTNDVITRGQIMYKLNITDNEVDKLMFYIKHNLCRDRFNTSVMIANEGFRVEFLKTKKFTKMYIIKN